MKNVKEMTNQEPILSKIDEKLILQKKAEEALNNLRNIRATLPQVDVVEVIRAIRENNYGVRECQ